MRNQLADELATFNLPIKYEEDRLLTDELIALLTIFNLLTKYKEDSPLADKLRIN